MEQILDSLQWVEDLLPHDIQSLPKHGGMAYYLDSHLVLILVEKSESKPLRKFQQQKHRSRRRNPRK